MHQLEHVPRERGPAKVKGRHSGHKRQGVVEGSQVAGPIQKKSGVMKGRGKGRRGGWRYSRVRLSREREATGDLEENASAMASLTFWMGTMQSVWQALR